MIEGFDWVPFFEEMAKKLLTFHSRQRELVEILRKAGVESGLSDRDDKGATVVLKEIDPFTFTSLVNKQSDRKRKVIFESLKEQLGITAEAPTQFLGVPKANAQQAWLFPYQSERIPGDVEKLWRLYAQIVKGEELTESVFSAAKSVRFAGKAKFTQAIFRAAPRRFFPVDGQTTIYLARKGLQSTFKTAREYQEICTAVHDEVDKPFYVQSYDAWLANQNKAMDAEATYQKAVLKQAISKRKKTYSEPIGGLPLPRPKAQNAIFSGYQRNAAAAAAALRNANFKCEIDPTHQTFTSSAKKLQYVEAHHLVPFSNQTDFVVSLDCEANIVALCPNCHRRLHHGAAVEKKGDLRRLFKTREKSLNEKEIDVSEKMLLSYYQRDLIAEDS